MISRTSRLWLAVAGLVFAAQPVVAQTAAPAPAATPWLYRGSDIPPDPAWRFGELANGVRYAVRRSGVPPQQVSIRVAIDAGALNEGPGEKGFAHFNEHLAFRGSKYIADGEAKRAWQRLGATFGSDTNATTSPTQTVYKLDLPSATPESIDESLKILSGMMAAPAISAHGVDTEKRTVLAELREGQGAQQRVGEALRRVLYAGQRLGDASNAREMASVGAATPAALRAFHDRWYRPSRTLVVLVGDAEPAMLAAAVERHFGSWQGVGPNVPDSDFGRPSATGPRARVIVEPGNARLVTLAVMRPWVPKADTIAMNRDRQTLELAARLINRRLETRARAGGSYLSAGVDIGDVARSANGTTIQIVPIGSNWESAVRDVRAVIADALRRPPTRAEIDREVVEYTANLQQAVDTESVQDSRELADNLVEAVNIRETVASAAVAKDVFTNLGARLQPAAMLAATRRLFVGTPMRAAVTLPRPEPRAEARLLAALSAPVAPSRVVTAGTVSIDQLPPFGPPATVTATVPVSELRVERITLSNGVSLLLFPNQAEPSRVYVGVRFGQGRRGVAPAPNPLWAGDAALVPSGIGPFGLDALDQLTTGQQIGMDFGIADDAFTFRATTNPRDLPAQLKLLAAKLAYPRWDTAPVVRARAAALTGLGAAQATASSVLQRALPGWLHNGDARWAAPTEAQIAALTPQAFRAFWEPLLRTGPIELSIYGDVERERAIQLAAATFGALPPRVPGPQVATSTPITPGTTRLTHNGPANQAAAVLAWPTAGGSVDIAESRRLDILAAVFNDRMFDELREAEGESYSPSVQSSWPNVQGGTGAFLVLSQAQPNSVARFFAVAEKIAADLRVKPVTDDELQRALVPMKQAIARASTGNGFWLSQLSGASGDPKRIDAALSIGNDYAGITAADLQATAGRWLVDGKASRLIVLPRAVGSTPRR